MSDERNKEREKGASPDIQRRAVFVIGCAGLGAATLGFAGATVRYLVPNVLYEPSRRFTIGSPSDFPPGSATFLPERRLFIFNGADGLYCGDLCVQHAVIEPGLSFRVGATEITLVERRG